MLVESHVFSRSRADPGPISARSRRDLGRISQVLEGLQVSSSRSALLSGSAVAAGEFTECTFLFAKIVGLRVLTDDETRDPQEVVEVLQVMMIAPPLHPDDALIAPFIHLDDALMKRV